MEENNTNIELKQVIQGRYVEHLLEHGKQPVSIFAFCKEIEIEEVDFYANYASFNSLEKYIWLSFFEHTQSAINSDEDFSSFTAQEKVQSFLYTLVEVFNQNKSFIKQQFKMLNCLKFNQSVLALFRTEFMAWSSTVLSEGMVNGEIEMRPFISEKYNEALWIQFLYLLKVWTSDESEENATTDAAIEKTSVMLFELLKKGPLDMFIDFAKFAYQHKAF